MYYLLIDHVFEGKDTRVVYCADHTTLKYEKNDWEILKENLEYFGIFELENDVCFLNILNGQNFCIMSEEYKIETEFFELIEKMKKEKQLNTKT